MKNLSLSLFVIIFVSLLTSCKKEKLQEDITVLTQEEKVECPPFYEGLNCDEEIRIRYYGKYKGTLTNIGFNELECRTLLIEGIEEFPNQIQVGGFGIGILSEFEEGKFELPFQPFGDDYVEGAGNFIDNKVFLNIKSTTKAFGIVVHSTFIGTRED